MKESLDILGAVTAYVFFVSSIVKFVSRMVFQSSPGHWLGVSILLMAFPLTYLLIQVPVFDRSPLYYVQIGVMLLWLAVLFVVDYVLR